MAVETQIIWIKKYNKIFSVNIPSRKRMNMKSGLSPIHPGEYLAELLEELRISQAALARILGVSPMRISHIVNCARPVTAEMAMLLGKAFGQTPGYWLNLQNTFDLKSVEAKMVKRLKSVEATMAKRLKSVHSLALD